MMPCQTEPSKTKDRVMAKRSNYGFEKRHKEMAKKKKQEEKRQRKQEKKDQKPEENAEDQDPGKDQ